MIRHIARRAAKWLPQSARTRLAARRFGYAQPGADLRVRETALPDGNIEFVFDGRLRMVVTPDAEQDIRFHLVENGDSRDEMASFLRASRAATGDALLVDVGAHKGLFSLVHLLTGPAHRAVLVEPSPPRAAASRLLLGLNGGSDRAEVRVAGADAADGTWSIVPDALGFARPAAPGDPRAVTVPLLTLDALCDGALHDPSIVKIDVEGAEGDVLRGARAMLRRRAPVICLELHLDILERNGDPVAGIVDALLEDGYALSTTTGQRLAAWQVKQSLKAILRIVATK